MSGWQPGLERPAPASPASVPASRRSGPHIGPLQITPIRAAIALAFFGSSAFILWAILGVRDVSQIPMLSSGFLVLGVSLVAVAIGALLEMWRAASRARTARAMLLAIVGGVAGFGAMGCFTLTVILALVWKSG